MKIGLLSDSHKNIKNLKDAAKYLKKVEKVDWLVHLGDDYDDASVLAESSFHIFGKRVYLLKVPGVYDPEYKDPNIDNRIIKSFDQWKMLFTHTPGKHENDLPDDVNPELASQSLGVKMIVHGHTHIPNIEERNNVFYINPGHLKDDDNRGVAPSFGMLDVSKNEVLVRIIGLYKKNEVKKLSIVSFTR